MCTERTLFLCYVQIYIAYTVRPESFRLNALHSNANIAHAANASTDLHSFNHVCMHLHVCAIVNVWDCAFV